MLAGDPLGGVLMTALGTSPMVAGMIGEMELALLAAISFTAQGRGATRQKGLDGVLVRGQDFVAPAPLVRWPMIGQDLGQLEHRGGIA